MNKTKSRYGVYYDLSESPYQFHDGTHGFIFYFSSRYNLDRFTTKLPECLAMMCHKTECVGVTVDCYLMSVFMAYTKTENRGFFVRQGVKQYKMPCEVVI